MSTNIKRSPQYGLKFQHLGLSVKIPEAAIHFLSAPRPAVLFGGRKVFFYTAPGFGLFEILEPS